MEAKAFSPFYRTAVYDFDDDGGAQGVIQSNTFIPPRSIVLMHTVLGDVLPVGPGALVGTGVVGDANAFLAQTAIAAYSSGAVIAGVDLQAVPLYFATGVEIAFNITVADLTAGRFFVNVWGWQMPSPLT